MSRKRSRRDFDDSNGSKRVSRQIPPTAALRRDLFALGDPGRYATLEDIDIVAERIGRADPAILLPDDVVSAIRDCVLAVPVKVPHYSALVVRITHHNPRLANHLTLHMADELPDLLSRGQFTAVKLLMRFYAAITHCADAATLVRHWIERLAELLEGNFHVSAAETILMTMAYHITYAEQVDFPNMATVLSRMRSAVDSMPQADAVFVQPIPYDARTHVALLLEQLELSIQRRRAPRCLPIDLAGRLLAPPNLEMPTPELSDWPRSQARAAQLVRVFRDQSISTLPEESDLADGVLRDLVVDILGAYVKNRQEAARFLMDVECYLAPGTFVLRGTPVDKIPAGGPTWKAEDVVIEAVFSQLFRLPVAEHKHIYYHGVLTELCKMVPQAIAPAFGRAIRTVYGWLPVLEPELSYRFGSWFAQHLSNFGYNWKWQDWVEVLSTESPARVFLTETIWREAEYSYCQRVRTTLPDEFLTILPEDMPPLRFEMAAEADECLAAPEGELLVNVLKSASESQALQLYTECLLRTEARSCAQAIDRITGHSGELTSFLQSDPRKLGEQMIRIVMSVWRDRPSIGVQICLFLAHQQLVQPEAFVPYLIDLAQGDDLRWYTFELVGGLCELFMATSDDVSVAQEAVQAMAGKTSTGLARMIVRRLADVSQKTVKDEHT